MFSTMSLKNILVDVSWENLSIERFWHTKKNPVSIRTQVDVEIENYLGTIISAIYFFAKRKFSGVKLLILVYSDLKFLSEHFFSSS